MTAIPSSLQFAINALRDSAGRGETGPWPQLLQPIESELRAQGSHTLADVCLLLAELSAAPAPQQSATAAAALAAWAGQLQAYLSHGADPGPLVQTLGDPVWSTPLDADDLQVLTQGLAPDVHADLQDNAGAIAPVAVEPDPPASATGQADAASASTTPDAAELPEAVQELIDLLRQELAAVATMLPADPDGQPEATELEHLAEEISRFAEASEAAGFAGLRQVLEFAAGNLGLIALTPAQAQPALQGLKTLLQALSDYLDAPGAAAACTALLASTYVADWPAPADEASRAAMAAALAAPDLEVTSAETPLRPLQASDEDVSLELPEDVEPELLDSLLLELPGHTAEFSRRVQAFLGGGSSEDVEAARRIAHTVKGAANTVGVPGIANLTHQLEDVLEAFSKRGRLPGAALVETLIEAADCLEAMTETLTTGSEAPADAAEVLQQVLDWANRIDSEGLPDEDMPPPGPAKPAEAAAQTAALSGPTAEDTDEDEEAATARPPLRVAAERIDHLLALMGENLILNGQVHERLRGSMQHIRAMRELFGQMQQLGYDLEQLVDVKDLAGPRLQAVGADFDPLEMDEFNEFHTISNRMVEAATDAREMLGGLESRLAEVDALLVEQGRLNRESHDAVMLTRMLPVATIVPRLHRSVRQTARLTGKSVQLTVNGEHTLIDSGVLTDLVDPLMHVLRNAVDHGLEDPAGRRAAGKPETGRITLDFAREGAQVVVSCQDDGRGLDLAAIRAAAEARGLIEAGQAIDDDQLRRLVFHSGLSTRQRATQISGRGVGMDVVNSAVIGLGGFVEISSDPGQGVGLRMRLPLSVISTHAILVRVRRQILAIANRGIQQILYAGSGEILGPEDALSFRIDDEQYPALPIENLLGMTHDPRGAERAPRSAMLVQSETGPRVVLVENVLDSRDVVIKSLGRYLPRLPGIVGATILGDGTVTPVIDLPDLLRAGRRPQQGVAEAPLMAQSEEQEPALPGALVVDDSLSARRSMRRVMEEIGFKVRTARDGLEAVEILASYQPDILLVDLEMPRMNGLELTAHVRAQPQTAKLPIIMVTSRSTHKHRRQAEDAGINAYFTKPVAEDELFDTVGRLYYRR